MLRIDAFYLYGVGVALHPLRAYKHSTIWKNAVIELYIAESKLDEFLNNSVFSHSIKMARPKGLELLQVLRESKAEAEKDENKDKEMGWYSAFRLTSGNSEFETVLGAELGQADIFLVLKKGGYDLGELIDHGISLFPPDLSTKVPEVVMDCNAASRCIAFNLPTAAGFHLHRANETVLRRYYDAVTNGTKRPANRTMQAYLSALDNKKVGDPKVRAALRDLKDLHRNPLVHPEDNLDSVEDAVALLGSIYSVMVHMLKAIPATPPAAPAKTAA